MRQNGLDERNMRMQIQGFKWGRGDPPQYSLENDNSALGGGRHLSVLRDYEVGHDVVK